MIITFMITKLLIIEQENKADSTEQDFSMSGIFCNFAA